MATCISEPVSWLRLERHALERDASVAEHIAACAACRACLDEIERDVVALPPLAVPARRRPWWHIAMPIGGALVATAIVLLVIRPRETPLSDRTSVKGLGDVIVDVVRERGGVVREGVRSYVDGDRWKVLVTCANAGTARMTVDVGGDRPLPPTDIVCGNRIVLPGAFSLTGSGEQRVCVTLASTGESGTACVTLRPE